MIDGIVSVDYLIRATGEGVVNRNGTAPAFSPAADAVVTNHEWPKLRGFDPFRRRNDTHGGETWARLCSLGDADLDEAALVVSAACWRSALFRDVSFGLRQVTDDNIEAVLASLHGLVRGYFTPTPGQRRSRKTPLLATELVCERPGLRFDQGSTALLQGTERQAASIHSHFATDAELDYRGKASLSVEDLAWIPLEDSLGRTAYLPSVTWEAGERIAARITDALCAIAPAECRPTATFLTDVVRRGAVDPAAEAGVLLDDDAIRVIAEEIRTLIDRLVIRQGRGYLAVTDVLIDYNDSTRPFRAECDRGLAVGLPTMPFARYYEVRPASPHR